MPYCKYFRDVVSHDEHMDVSVLIASIRLHNEHETPAGTGLIVSFMSVGS